jgi:hypothetical protein
VELLGSAPNTVELLEQLTDRGRMLIPPAIDGFILPKNAAHARLPAAATAVGAEMDRLQLRVGEKRRALLINFATKPWTMASGPDHYAVQDKDIGYVNFGDSSDS